jgi:hypothetical protein
MGNNGDLNGSGGLSVGFARFGRQPFGMRLIAGYGFPFRLALPAGYQGTLRRVPMRLSAFFSLPVGPGRLEPGLDGGVEVLLASVSGGEITQTGRRAAPSVAAALGYTLPLARHVYARASARSGVGTPFTFMVTTNSDRVASFSTPRVFVEIGVESGVSFP